MRYLKVLVLAAMVVALAVSAFADNCPACGAEVQPDAEVCPACGAKITKQAPKTADPAAAAKKLYDDTVAAVGRSKDHAANVGTLEASAKKLEGTACAGKLDELLAQERKLADEDAAKATATLAAAAEMKKTCDALVESVKASKDYADNISRVEKLLASCKGTEFEKPLGDLLAEQKKLLSQERAAASAKEKAERDKLFKDVSAEVRRSKDRGSNIAKLEEAAKSLAGTEYEPQVKKLLDSEKAALEADKTAAREAEAKKVHDEALAAVKASKDRAANVKTLEDAATKLVGSKCEGKLASAIDAEKKAIEKAAADSAAAAKAAEDAKAAAAKAAEEAKARSEKAKQVSEAVLTSVAASGDAAANVDALKKALPDVTGTEYEAKVKTELAAQEKVLAEKQKASADAAAAAKAAEDAAADAKKEAQKVLTDLKALVKRSKDRAANVKAADEAVKKLAGTEFEAEAKKILESEQAAAASDERAAADAAKRDEAARAEAAAKKVHDDALASVKRSKDRAANVKTLEEAAAKLRGTAYEGRLDASIAAENKALADAGEAAKLAEAAKAEAAAKKIHDDALAAVKRSKDRAENVKTLETAAAGLKGTPYEGRLEAAIEAEKKAVESAGTAPAATDAEKAEAAAKKVYDDAVAAAKRSGDHAANVEKLKAAADKLKGSSCEGKLDEMIASEAKASEAALATAASRDAAKKLFDELKVSVKRSADRAANVKAIEEALPKLAGTEDEAQAKAMLDSEKQALADAEAASKRDEAARAEAAAKKVHDDALAAVKRSTDHAANLKTLEEASAKLAGSKYDGKLAAAIETEKKAVADAGEAAKLAEIARAEAAAKKVHDDAVAAAKRSGDHAANVEKLKAVADKLKGTPYEGKLDELVASETKAAGEAATAAAASAKTAEEAAKLAAEQKKLYDDTMAAVKGSSDRAANIASLDAAAQTLKGSDYEPKLAAAAAAERKALDEERAKAAATEAQAAKAALEKIFKDVSAEVRASSDHAANTKKLEDSLAKLAGSEFETQVKRLIDAEKKAISDTEETAKRAEAALAEASLKKVCDDALAAVKASKDRAANVKTLEEAAAKLKGTAYEGKLGASIAAENKALADAGEAAKREEAARAEAALKKVCDDALAAVKLSKDRAANVKTLEEAAAKLKGTAYEGRLDASIAAENKAMADAGEAAKLAEAAKAEAAAKKIHDDALAAVKRSTDRVANVKTLEEAAAKLAGTKYEEKLASALDAEKKALTAELATAEEKARAAELAKKTCEETLARVRASKDREANVKDLKLALQQLAGTEQVAVLDAQLKVEQKALADEQRAEQEGVFNAAVSAAKASSDHEANAKLLREAAVKVAGSEFEPKLKRMADDEAAKHSQELAELKRREDEERAKRAEKPPSTPAAAPAVAGTEEAPTTPEGIFAKARQLARSAPEESVALYQSVMKMKDAEGRFHPLAKDAAYAIAELYASQPRKNYSGVESSQMRAGSNWELAARYFSAAAKLDPEQMSDGLYRAGELYQKLGDPKKARLTFEKAAEETRNPAVQKSALRAAAKIVD